MNDIILSEKIEKNKRETLDYISNLESYPFNPIIESIIDNVLQILDRANRDFIRLQVNMALAVIPGMLHTKVLKEMGITLTTNFYGVGLGPSGCGKTSAFQLLQNTILSEPLKNLKQLSKVYIAQNLHKIAEQNVERILQETNDDEDDRDKDPELLYRKELKRLGTIVEDLGSTPAFIRGFTPAALEQVRKKICLTKFGGINITVDEIGYEIGKLKEGSTQLFSLYDSGVIEEDIRKNTRESQRIHFDTIPVNTNLLFYGTPDVLLDSSSNEKLFRDMLTSGLARRSFFVYLNEIDKDAIFTKDLNEIIQQKIQGSANAYLNDFGNIICNEIIKELSYKDDISTTYRLTEEAQKEFLLYDRACNYRSYAESDLSILGTELKARAIKVLKLAGIYAVYDEKCRESGKISLDCLKYAIKFAESSQQALEQLSNTTPCHIKLAKFIYNKYKLTKKPVYEVDLNELKFFEEASKSKQLSYIDYARAYSYINNKYIQKEEDIKGNAIFTVEEFSPTSLDHLIISVANFNNGHNYSDNFYNSPDNFTWDRLLQYTQNPDLLLCNHRLKQENNQNGTGHREDKNIIPGFNLVFLDIDNGQASLKEVEALLSDYHYYIYTTKSHTYTNNAFRVILPLKYTVNLNKEDYTIFMENIYNYLSFNLDRVCKDRTRAWACYKSEYTKENKGNLIDPLKFIPKTSENDNYNTRSKNIQIKSITQLDKFFIEEINQNGNRNNNLFKYQMMLKDSGLNNEEVKKKVIRLNNLLNIPLHNSEIEQTIFKRLDKD